LLNVVCPAAASPAITVGVVVSVVDPPPFVAKGDVNTVNAMSTPRAITIASE
jgi:hypothetical protein